DELADGVAHHALLFRQQRVDIIEVGIRRQRRRVLLRLPALCRAISHCICQSSLENDCADHLICPVECRVPCQDITEQWGAATPYARARWANTGDKRVGALTLARKTDYTAKK